MRSFFLSQDHLTTLERCPRQYQYIYVDRLTTPVSVTQQRAQEWGKHFHQLMQQQALGLPLDQVLTRLSTGADADLKPETAPQPSETQLREELAQCLHALGEQEPDIFGKTAQDTHQSDRIQHSEHSRSFLWLSLPTLSALTPSNAPENPQAQPINSISTFSPDRWLLRVIYDRLVLTPQTAEILDWKTYPQPPNLQWIRQNWQTRLYLFVLAETSAYTPEQLSMTYWFVRHTNTNPEVLSPQSHTIPYDRHAHEQTRTDLSHWIDRLSHWYRAYENGAYPVSTPFPMLPESSPQCHTCPFNQRCQRAPSSFQVNYNHAMSAINLIRKPKDDRKG